MPHCRLQQLSFRQSIQGPLPILPRTMGPPTLQAPANFSKAETKMGGTNILQIDPRMRYKRS
ncbi:uncharacterized protein G2W53_020288 [Senna tora]|uniref:Uncharacterized protein n=1 Tax=Senna tora TaxID=362788 RepID=A0A834U325_9FABA|nr:uncharacterized protein G2W53_020288 [Senna tora]